MKAARDLLLAAVEEQRPIVLLLGQDAWSEPGNQDAILAKALKWLGRTGDDSRGWSAILGPNSIPQSFYVWLAERFERRVAPTWLEILRELPWSAVFTSALDPTLKALLEGQGREPEVILTGREMPRAVRSRARPPLYYLFGCAGADDPNARPPVDRSELNTRRVGHALPLLGRVLDTATTLGPVIVDGFVSGRDWLKIEDILGAVGTAAPQQVLWFGGRSPPAAEDAVDFEAAVASGRIVVEPERLGTVIAEIRALGWLPDFTPPESEEAGIISFKSGKRLETTPEVRLRVEAVASVVDDAWTALLAPLGPDAEYDAFRRFHGDLGGPRLLVEGVRRGFAIERDFEGNLLRQVNAALADHASAGPIVVHGQSGTGKSVALARIVAQVREKKTAAVLYSIGRVPQSDEVSSFCEAAEHSGAEATLIVCDANRNVDAYRDLLVGLRSRGRRVVVLGSRYRIADSAARGARWSIEAPAEASQKERQKLKSLLAQYVDVMPDLKALDFHILGLLYRFLPPSRPRISARLGAEVRAAVHTLRERGRQKRPVLPDTQLAQKLIEAGFHDGYRPTFDEHQSDVLESGDAAGRLIDLVMVAGSLNCPVPVNLLLRAVTEAIPGLNLSLIGELFGDLDLLRWKWADLEQSELLVFPRLALEAELICRRRLGSPEKEAERLIELIRSFRYSGVDGEHERRFLFSLLSQMGPDGPRGVRYGSAYVDVARTLTELRRRHGVIHPGLMRQESLFRRVAVRENMVDESDRLLLLEEGRDAVQAALDGIANGTIRAPKRTHQNLQVERASLYGFLAYDRAWRKATRAEIWSSYEAAREAIRRAVSVTDAYFPLDVGLWTPLDLLKMAGLTEAQQVELTADIYATLDQVDPQALSPDQRERFDKRRMKIGQQLQDQSLTEDAYLALEASGSKAGYYLRARGLGPDLNPDQVEISGADDLEGARRATDFLQRHLSKIEHDERCLSLLLEYRWIAELGRRPLRGERQPLPVDHTTRRDLLGIVHMLNQASGEAARHGTRYLEAVLAWTIGDVQLANRIFRDLSRETENEDPGRVIRRHLITGQDLRPRRFEGRIENQRSEGNWLVRVYGLKQLINLRDRDFPRYELAYGRSIKEFAIAFNFIGPIADPIRSR